ncbi:MULTISPECIES: glutathione S-transferase C-terminal domain-containing protein [Aerococcus]|uniref:glutathione S-transferase C-terminal domain-containing protein n=1 Tax=Aerococcus urinae (strain CCUG 59500 / ACS-120-V-Col10a) TaxID=2976812 RepID=UPI000200E5AA|nr:glutathione S-transferase C-terminal domain-containing protein [Aerococcus sp. Group 1]AEA01909.1 glutathione S-transferase, C-terminal domain protein [Aerococcus sp. Group 1]MCY3030416.1 glutathione S-transferase C-terminal domain-containing protein [Aerococcus sp. Group 1]MCY3054832.1 glutathione S-transferase C-terminal domain-containing protein [Aerococcus sp. Group 1]MCY3056562.1 glutathione S-transferase C-terminal domain-containing protein [Aerococcus sp. Group 1]MCY3061856.1 glutath
MSRVYDKDYDYPVESGRYQLVISQSCPFAQRTDIVRSLLGLEDVIGKSVTSPIKTDKIWDFSNQAGNQDAVLQVEYLSELYHNTDPNYDGPYSVPALVDLTTKEVVSQESLDIIKDFSTRFKDLGTSQVEDLYPADQRAAIDQCFDRIGSDLIGAPAKAHQASEQADYKKYADQFFDSLAEIDQALTGQDYLVGNRLTLADVVLYTPLVRFDTTYYTAFQVNKYRLSDFPHLWDHLQQLHQIPAFHQSTNFQAIKEGTYLGKNGRDSFGKEILPQGPVLDMWEVK